MSYESESEEYTENKCSSCFVVFFCFVRSLSPHSANNLIIIIIFILKKLIHKNVW